MDSLYFSSGSWRQRVDAWLANEKHAGNDNPFLTSNVDLVRKILDDSKTGLRVVVNISTDALLNFLYQREYKNLYEEPVIGGKRRTPSQERQDVDRMLGFGTAAKNYYFGAVALGGTGVRFYGEFCMVLRRDELRPDTKLFDRDSYDLLLPPLIGSDDMNGMIGMLRGEWSDVVDMLTLRLLPELRNMNRLITIGTISELVLHDQEFVEVHHDSRITPDVIEEVRQSPDEVALEARILARSRAGLPFNAVELRWLDQRQRLMRALALRKVQYRIVTLHGRGYQWR
jgi:hypothetical protein